MVALAALSLTCSDDPGGGGKDETVVSGRAVLGGAIVDAEVVVYQLATATGQRTNERGRGRTGPLGEFSIPLGGTLNTVEIDVIGGSYLDVASGATVERGAAILHGLAFDLALSEKRTDAHVTPWSHLVYALGERLAATDADPSARLARLKQARDLFAAHLGFDPTHTALAAPDQPTTTATPEFLHGASLAGLAMRAKLANDDGFADVTAQTFVDVLDQDARGGDPAHAFDGNGDALAVTAICPSPPPPCTARGPGCYSTCTVGPHLLRAHLGGAVRAYLRAHPGSGQTAATLATWLEGIRTADEPLLFPPGDPEPYDDLAPRILWAAPATDGGTVANEIRIDVAAEDPSGVASLTVTVERPDGSIQRTVVDTDPSPDRFVAMLDTRGLDEGEMILRATATDADDNANDQPTRTLDLNNIPFGTVTVTVAVSGRVASAPVRVYAFDTGTRGALLGEATAPTNIDGIASNLQIQDGYSGPLLIEAGGAGTYREDAAPSGTDPVELDVDDVLRTVVGDYRDGDAISSVVITPATTFGVAYFAFLRGHSSQSGASVADVWTDALGAMETHFSVANLRTLPPQRPEQMLTLAAATRHGLDLIGLSGLALAASTEGGGSGGSFGSTMSAMVIVRVLERDIRDGCWDGWDRGPTGGPTGTPLVFGGTEAPDDDTTRRTLANAIVAYLRDGARNQTPAFDSAADVLSLLDTLSSGGGNTATGSCVISGPGTIANQTFDDNGGLFDRTPPRIDFIGATPAAGFVRGTIVVEAEATDLPDMLDPAPVLRFLPTGVPPETPVDTDGDTSDRHARATFDTVMRLEGPLVVTLQATDDSNNSDTATRTFTVDNTPPIILITGVTDGGWYGGSGPTVGFSVDEDHLDTASALLDGLPFSSGGTISSHGMHTLVVTARDLAGTTASRSVTFYVDPIAPILALGPVTPSGAIVRGPLTIIATADDNLRALGSLGADITVTATGGSGAVAPTSMNPSTLGDGRRQVAPVFDTTAIPDGVLTVRFDVTDRAGNPAAPPLTLARTIDNTAPVPTVTGVTAGAWYGAGRTITFGQSDANPGTTTALLDGVSFTSGGMAATEGTHTLVITATDAAGGTGTLSITFTIDLGDPTLALVGPPPPTWVRGPLTLEVLASDTLAASGSLDTPIGLTAIGPAGAFTPMVTPELLANGQRRLTIMFNTTSLGDGMLSLTFTITDRAGHAAPALVINRTIDNTPPTIILLPVHNQNGAMINGWVNEDSATIAGTVSTGGSPVTVTVTTTPGGSSGDLTPDASGAFSYITATLPEGTITVNATAVDAAGNPSLTVAATPLTIDRTGPTTSFRPSEVVDERTCGVAYAMGLVATGTFSGAPVTYTNCDPSTGSTVTLTTGTPVVRKYVSRLASASPQENPLAWNVSASEAGGVGVAPSVDAVQFRVHRIGQPPSAIWIDTSSPLLNGGAVESIAYALSTNWPELLAHTSVDLSTAFVIEVRAKDRLGNVGPSITRSWQHRPLAPPVPLSFQGLAPQTYSMTEPLWPFSIFRNSLTPGANQAGPAEAMSTSIALEPAPRGIFEFTLWNPHPDPVTVGFFIPGVSGATYTKRVWETSPWISGTQGAMTDPINGTCPVNPPNTPWPNAGWSARVNHSAPYNCNTSPSACSCNGTTWNQPIDPPVFPDTASSTFSIGSGPQQHPFQVMAWDATTGDFLPRLNIQPMSEIVIGASTTHDYFEFTIPARVTPSVARRARILVALPNLDLFNPSTDYQTNPPLESDGPGSEVIKRGGNTVTTTAAFYERWGDCAFGSPNCTTARVRHRYRALVEGRLAIPMDRVFLNVRGRATSAATAAIEVIVGENESSNANSTAFLWEACEALGGYAGGACSPFVATTANSDTN